jgi:hypothetical protein
MYETPTVRDKADRTGFAVGLRVRRWRIRDFVIYNLILLIVAGFVYLRLTSPPPAISPETYDQVQIGMTWQEVHDIVRACPGGYGAVFNPHKWNSEKQPEQVAIRSDTWSSGDGVLTVGYDADGRVCEKSLGINEYRELSHPERWPWWKRQLHRRIPGEGAIFYSPF